MHPKVLGHESWDVVKRLARLGLLAGWTLAGGTGLALQLGHRISEDLDLFNTEPFDTDALIHNLSEAGRVKVLDRGPNTLHTMVNSTRVSYLITQAPFLFPGIPYRQLTLADPRDVVVMKLVAVGERGSRKDFVDLYYYLRSGGDLAQAMLWLETRFVDIDYNSYHILKSLTWFTDADTEPMPRMLKNVTWQEIKRAITNEARRLSP